MEIRRRSGLTWAELGDLFDVSRRSVHHWANGKPVTASHERMIRRMLAAVRHLDRGDQVSTRALLLTVDPGHGGCRARPLEGRPFRRSRRPCRGRPGAPSLTVPPLSHAARDARRPQAPALLLEAEQERPDIPARARAGRTKRTPTTTGLMLLSGCETDDDLRDFARALARKRSQFAFPDDFVAAARRLQEHLADKHNRQTDEGAHLRALREIRVRAAPSWDDGEVRLSWWFIKDADPVDAPVDWSSFVDQWLALFDQTGRFRLEPPIACRLDDMTARDYVESDHLDLDRLSVS